MRRGLAISSVAGFRAFLLKSLCPMCARCMPLMLSGLNFGLGLRVTVFGFGFRVSGFGFRGTVDPGVPCHVFPQRFGRGETSAKREGAASILVELC